MLASDKGATAVGDLAPALYVVFLSDSKARVPIRCLPYHSFIFLLNYNATGEASYNSCFVHLQTDYLE